MDRFSDNLISCLRKLARILSSILSDCSLFHVNKCGMSDWEDDDGEFERSLVGVDLDDTAESVAGPKTQSSTTLQNKSTEAHFEHQAINNSLTSSLITSAQTGKNNALCTVSDPVELFKSPAVTNLAKRRFPGPAGKLPKLKKKVDLSRLKNQYINDESNSKKEEEVMSSQLSQTNGYNIVQSTAWLSMIEDLQISQQHLDTHCIKNALHNAANNRLPADGKIPLLLVLIESVDKTMPDATVLLRDMSGSMTGVIHRVLVKQYQHELNTGSALLLKRISIFRPCPRKQYLNITPNNLLRIYPESRNSVSSTPVHIISEPTDIDTLLIQPVCSSPSISNTTDRNTSSTACRKTSNLLNDIAMAPINQNTFNQNHTPAKTRQNESGRITKSNGSHSIAPVKVPQQFNHNPMNPRTCKNPSITPHEQNVNIIKHVVEPRTINKQVTEVPVIDTTSISKKISDIFDDDDLDDLDLTLID